MGEGLNRVYREGEEKEDDEREVAAENSIIPLLFNGNSEIVPAVVFVSENVYSVIIILYLILLK